MGFLSTLFGATVARLGALSLLPGAGLFASLANVVAAIINFFSTPLGRWVGIGLIGLALFAWGDVRRGKLDRIAHKAEIARLVKQSEARQKERDDAAKVAAKKDADARIAVIEKMLNDANRKVADNEKELAKRGPARSCLAAPADERGMRGL